MEMIELTRRVGVPSPRTRVTRAHNTIYVHTYLDTRTLTHIRAYSKNTYSNWIITETGRPVAGRLRRPFVSYTRQIPRARAGVLDAACASSRRIIFAARSPTPADGKAVRTAPAARFWPDVPSSSINSQPRRLVPSLGVRCGGRQDDR